MSVAQLGLEGQICKKSPYDSWACNARGTSEAEPKCHASRPMTEAPVSVGWVQDEEAGNRAAE